MQTSTNITEEQRQHQSPSQGQGQPRLDTGAAALWASAFIVCALLLSVASRRLPGQQALADVSEVGDLTVMTASAGDNDDILTILDRREESLHVYGIDASRKITLLQHVDIGKLFQQARAAASR